MWKSRMENTPIILSVRDWSPEEYAVICKALGVEDDCNSIVIRENCVIEIEIE